MRVAVANAIWPCIARSRPCCMLLQQPKLKICIDKFLEKIYHCSEPPMRFSKIDYSATPIKEYKVYGCRTPSATEPQPQIFASSIFAKDTVYAQARFLKLINKQYKIKATNATILRVEEVEQDKDMELKNYGIKFVYRTRAGLQNAYKEVRHVNRVLAVSGLNQEFGARHKIASHEIYIYDVRQLKDEEVKKAKILSYMGDDVMFPVFLKVPNTEAEVVPATADIFN